MLPALPTAMEDRAQALSPYPCPPSPGRFGTYLPFASAASLEAGTVAISFLEQAMVIKHQGPRVCQMDSPMTPHQDPIGSSHIRAEQTDLGHVRGKDTLGLAI